VAAVLGAVVWAAVTVGTGYQIGWMAVGVGFLVGMAVMVASKGGGPLFGFIGAGCALFGCVLGNLLSGIGFLAQALEIGYFDALTGFDFSMSFMLLKETFSPMDVLFYGIAIFEGYKFAAAEES
jgi:hypothetical protein